MIPVVISLTFLLLTGSLAFVPFVTRRTELFGVTIPIAAWGNEECRRLRASYRDRALGLGVVFTAAAALGSAFLPLDTAVGLVFFILAMALYMVICFALYLARHRRAKKLKAELGYSMEGNPGVVVVDTNPPQRDSLSPYWLLLYPVIPALTILGIMLVWPYAPDPIPLHYGLDGIPDRFIAKTPGAIGIMLFPQVLLLLIFALTYLLARNAKRQIDAGSAETSRQQGRRFRRITSASLIFGGVLLGVYLGALEICMLLNIGYKIIMGSSIGLLVLVGAGIALMMFFVGQGGSRIPVPSDQSDLSPGENSPVGSPRDDDRYWKLGQFYCNPKDPAVFVEKRFGVGFTVNIARPGGWIFLAGILIIIAGSIVLAVVRDWHL
ncbi:membrane protein [Spirochaetia bacterium]|nr:membrane protein [Spirochaetia bacterium]